MEVAFRDSSLDRLEVDSQFDAGLPRAVVKAFRKRIRFIRDADDERDLYAMNSLRFEKLKGKRKGESSIRLNDQWRLILTLRKKGRKTIVDLVSIEDYH